MPPWVVLKLSPSSCLCYLHVLYSSNLPYLLHDDDDDDEVSVNYLILNCVAMPWFVLNQTRNSVDKDGGMPASAGPQANKCTSAAALGVETKRIFIETSLAQIHPRLQSLTLLSSSPSSSCFLGVYKEREAPASTTSTRLIGKAA